MKATSSSRRGVASRPEWILVTGQPGCGKTTAVKKMVDFLQARGLSCRGFYTDEVLDPKTKSRIGFDVVSVPDGKRGILSRKAGHGVSTSYKTGQYFVDVESFEAIALPSLETKASTGIENELNGMNGGKKRKLNGSNRTGTAITKADGKEMKEGEILVLDEIGRMELHSKAFSDRVLALLSESENHRLIGAVTAPIYGHRVPFCDEVTSREGVEVHKLTKKTREHVLGQVLRLIQDKGWC